MRSPVNAWALLGLLLVGVSAALVLHAIAAWGRSAVRYVAWVVLVFREWVA